MKNSLICEVVMFPAKGESKLLHDEKVGLEYSHVRSPDFNHAKAQHLYFTSRREIKEGDWFITKTGVFQRDNESTKLGNVGVAMGDTALYNIKGSAFRIEATTDPSLNMPLIHDEFIEEYAYSNGSLKEVEIKLAKYSHWADKDGREFLTASSMEYGKEPFLYFSRGEIKRRCDNTVIIMSPQSSDEHLDELIYWLNDECPEGTVTHELSHDFAQRLRERINSLMKN